jgi:sec-independent protein translocase protein TatA
MFRNPTTDLIVVLVIVLLIFGPKRLPGLGKQLGTGLREFKESITGENKDEEQASRPEITAATSTGAADSAPAATPTERESAEVGPQSRS